LICLGDGKHFNSLKRLLAADGLTPEQYREIWKLSSDHPVVASNYAATRVSDCESNWSWTVARKRPSAKTRTPAEGDSSLIRIAADPHQEQNASTSVAVLEPWRSRVNRSVTFAAYVCAS
jgi:hypothetical protein